MTKILDWLKTMLGEQVVGYLLKKYVTVENVIKIKNIALDKVLDEIEDYCAKNSVSWDETALKAIREALNVPDNDEPKAPPTA